MKGIRKKLNRKQKEELNRIFDRFVIRIPYCKPELYENLKGENAVVSVFLWELYHELSISDVQIPFVEVFDALRRFIHDELGRINYRTPEFKKAVQDCISSFFPNCKNCTKN